MAQTPKTSLQIVRQAPETVTDRIKALQSQMSALAAQQSAELRGAMLEAQRFAVIPSLLVIVLILAGVWS